VVPNVLVAPGAVVSTSTKPDVLEATAAARSSVGSVLLYDPSGTVPPSPGVRRVGWSPIHASGEWDLALSVADGMVRAAATTGGRAEPGFDSHWSERAGALLAPLLHAASLDGAPMSRLLTWVDRHAGEEALRTLHQHLGEHHPATDVLAGVLTTDGREQSGIWSTASGVLAAYRGTAALASTAPPLLDARAFCDGPHALYVCAAGRHQQLLAPLVVGLLGDIRDAAYERARAGGREPPVVFALDEVANIAPLPDLPALVSEGAGQGLLTLACLQDLSQARRRWGQEADAFLSLFATTVVLPGIADLATLEALSALAGDVEVVSRTWSAALGSDRRRHDSVSLAAVERRRLTVDQAARGRPGEALALDFANRIGRVLLTPAHATNPWRDLLGPHARRRPLPELEARADLGRGR